MRWQTYRRSWQPNKVNTCYLHCCCGLPGHLLQRWGWGTLVLHRSGLLPTVSLLSSFYLITFLPLLLLPPASLPLFLVLRRYCLFLLFPSSPQVARQKTRRRRRARGVALLPESWPTKFFGRDPVKSKLLNSITFQLLSQSSHEPYYIWKTSIPWGAKHRLADNIPLDNFPPVNFPPDKCPYGQIPRQTTSPRTSSRSDKFPGRQASKKDKFHPENFPPDKFQIGQLPPGQVPRRGSCPGGSCLLAQNIASTSGFWLTANPRIPGSLGLVPTGSTPKINKTFIDRLP